MTIDHEQEALYNNKLLVPDSAELSQEFSSLSAKFRAQAGGDLDISYGPSERQKYDLFLPQSGLEAPALVVYIHGGYWQWRDRKDFSEAARGLWTQGLPVATPSYDLCPTVSVADIVIQIGSCCAHLWKTYQKPLIITGHSAGGHLTATMLAADWAASGAPDIKILGGVPISGVFDLRPLVNTSINDPLGLDDAGAEAISPLLWTPTVAAPMHAYVGGGESQGFLDQSHEFAEKWGGFGMTTDCSEIAGANHFTILNELRDPASAMVKTIAAMAG